MLKLLKKRKSEGFTIIEVLIVLAIAGLIMVIVFLAVPALQRSGRNTGLSTDANNVLSGVGEYVANNGGTLPPAGSVALAGTTATIGAAASNQATVTVDGNTSAVSLNTALTKASPVGSISIMTGANAKCNATNTGVTGGGTARTYSVLYVAESGSGNVLKCIGG